MNQKLETVKQEIIRLLRNIPNNEWVKANITIKFPPFINKAYKTQPFFWDNKNNRVKIFPTYDSPFEQSIFDLIVSANKDGQFNEITFQTFRDQYEKAEINISFNQETVDIFEQNLPKSQRGKTKAWFLEQ